MAIRNFCVDADIDGRQTMLSGGPRGKDGGMDITIYQRDEGAIKTAVQVYCRAYDGKVVTEVFADDECVARLETKR